MPVLSAANVVQAKTGTLTNGNPAQVVLDAGTTAGNTVTVEMYGPALWPGMPDGWQYDGTAPDAAPLLWCFRRSGVAAGEGVSGSTSWDWTYIAATNWLWRVTEWDTGLDPVGPFEAFAAGTTQNGTGVTAQSTGTTPSTNRAEVVALATHSWHRLANTAQSFDWSGHTNGFTERDDTRATMGNAEYDLSWSWLFASTPGTFECTATVNLGTRAASDSYNSLIVVYAAATPEIVPGAVVISSGAPAPAPGAP